ncbi:MFS family permease [Methanolinea mesophila]|uniref:MFS transporter n=1 Tax=Methanolinea mesophila TaxID=547055 RepID=UPI001AE2E001|nr:MFS transporter [Methanolinea mesophila]MBP1928101.1 MFS family permease [Methanolinea mesophila]
MKSRIPVFLGVFTVMALSNAIVPVLPGLAEGTVAQSALYSSYFFGALILVLPAGILADRIGELPLIRAGLLLTTLSGVLLLASSSSYMLLFSRFAEGFGAGLFVASGLAFLNARPDDARGSGIFLAMLNVGLVVGLIGTGWIVDMTGDRYAGVMLFTVLSLLPLLASMLMKPDRETSRRGEAAAGSGHSGTEGNPGGKSDLSRNTPTEPETFREILARSGRVIRQYFWLWVSAVIMIGITGALTAIYPQFSGLSPAIIGLQIAAMNVSTAVAVLIVPRANLHPITAIRVSAILMAGAVLLSFYTPWGFIPVGFLAGVVMIGQLTFLSRVEPRQGAVMGLFNVASYGGMTILPFIAGVVAQEVSFFAAFATSMLSALFIAATIGRCGCSDPGKKRDGRKTGD